MDAVSLEALRTKQRARGAVFGPDAGGAPRSFGDAAAEERAARAGAALIDRSGDDDGGRARVVVGGRDRASFLQGLVTNDLVALKPGSGCRSALLDVKGKVQALFDVLAVDDELWLCLPPAGCEPLVQFLDTFLIMEDATLAVSNELAPLSLQGPASAEILVRAAGLEGEEAVALVAAPRATRHRSAEIAGREVRLAAADESGLGGVYAWAPRAALGDVWEALLEAGATCVGQDAAEVLRIEAGVPLVGREADSDTLLPQLPMAGLVSWTKGCYLGQEPVARIRYRGRVNRLLCRVALEGADASVPDRGETLRVDDKDVGWITSAARSAERGASVALAQLRREYIGPGTRLTVGDAAAPATVLGPVDPDEMRRGDDAPGEAS